MFFLPVPRSRLNEYNVTDFMIMLNWVWIWWSILKEIVFLVKNYYTLSWYSSNFCNTFGELSASNRLADWLFVIYIFSPKIRDEVFFRSTIVETKIIFQTLASKKISGSFLHLWIWTFNIQFHNKWDCKSHFWNCEREFPHYL